MPNDPLIVPTVVPGGSLHFATITAEGTVQDVLDALVSNKEVTEEVLGDLEPYGWAVQRIRREHSGRQWEEEELEALGNGALAHSLGPCLAELMNVGTICSHRYPPVIHTGCTTIKHLLDRTFAKAFLCISVDVAPAYPDSPSSLITSIPVVDVLILARAGDTRWIPVEVVPI